MTHVSNLLIAISNRFPAWHGPPCEKCLPKSLRAQKKKQKKLPAMSSVRFWLRLKGEGTKYC